MKEQNDIPFVSVVMITYGHEKYIQEAINGVLMQECSYSIELIVANDASPDNTSDIVLYIKNTHPRGEWLKYHRHEINLGVQRNALWTYRESRGKYIAICEGDDYWTDPLKLQKQVDFLESNPDYGMVYGKAKLYDQKKEMFLNHEFGKCINSIQELLRQNVIPTQTICLRSDLYQQYEKEVSPQDKNWLMGDFPLNIWCMLNSKIKFMDETFACYRLLEKSASHFINSEIDKEINFIDNSFLIRNYFLEHYQLGEEIRAEMNDLHDDILFSRYLMVSDAKNIKRLQNIFFKKRRFKRYVISFYQKAKLACHKQLSKKSIPKT